MRTCPSRSTWITCSACSTGWRRRAETPLEAFDSRTDVRYDDDLTTRSFLPRKGFAVKIVRESTASLIERAAGCWLQMSRAQRELLAVLAELDRRAIWQGEGAHDMAHWVGNAFGLSRYR